MSQLITLEALDQDGAIRETAEAAGATRADFIKRGGMAGAGFLAGGVLFSGFVSPAEAAISTSRRSKKNDVQDRQLRARRSSTSSPSSTSRPTRRAASRSPSSRCSPASPARTSSSTSRPSRRVLGSAAVKKPKFDFGDTVTNQQKFQVTAQVLEDTGVAAYAGQGPNLLQRPLVKAALSIHSVEARHAAWIRYINSSGGVRTGQVSTYPAPQAFDKALGEKTVLKAVTKTGFIK